MVSTNIKKHNLNYIYFINFRCYNKKMNILYENSNFTNFVTYLLPILLALFQIKSQFNEKETKEYVEKKISINNPTDIHHVNMDNGSTINISNHYDFDEENEKLITKFNEDYVKTKVYKTRKTLKLIKFYIFIITCFHIILQLNKDFPQFQVNLNQFIPLIPIYLNIILNIIKQILILFSMLSMAVSLRYFINIILYRNVSNLLNFLFFFISSIFLLFSINHYYSDIISSSNSIINSLIILFFVLIYKYLISLFQIILNRFYGLITDKPDASDQEISDINRIENFFIIIPAVTITIIFYIISYFHFL